MLKYTALEKAISVGRNLFKNHWKQLWYFFAPKVRRLIQKRYNIDIQVQFWWDLTQESDYDSRDYQLSGSDISLLPEVQRKTLYLADQGRAWRTRNSCVVINTLLALHNNLNIEFVWDDFILWLNWCEKEGIWKENEGAVIPTVVNRICKRWNELHPDRKVTYYRISGRSTQLSELLVKGYEIVGGHNTFPAYSQDQRDRKIDFDRYSDQKRRGGHCNNLILGKFAKHMMEARSGRKNILYREQALWEGLHIKNSYPTSLGSMSLYEHSRFANQVKNGVWYAWVYAIVEQDPKPIAKTVERVGDYRRLFGKSVIRDVETMGEVLTNGTNDEKVAAIEIISKRVHERG